MKDFQNKTKRKETTAICNIPSRIVRIDTRVPNEHAIQDELLRRPLYTT